MTKEKWLEIIKLIASFVVGIATIVLAQSCISSWNLNKNSQGATINSKQYTNIHPCQCTAKTKP